jgi:RNA polymerase sigma factor for flagellar operon FliA
MEAHAKFDPAKDVKFETFAQFRIRGAIFDTLRSLDWAPRELRHKGRAVQEAIRAITARTGQAPSEEQVAQELNTSLTSYQKLLGDLHNLEIGTLYRKSEDDSTEEELIYIPGRPEEDPLFCYMKTDMVERLTNAVDDLPEQERLVLTLYYYEELTRGEIAVVLGMDSNRVSQIRASAVLHLRAALSDLSPGHGRNITRMPNTRRTVPEHATLQMSVA